MNILKAYFNLSKNLLKLFFNLLYGIWQLAKLPQAPVTIFGGSKLKEDSKYKQQAHKLAHLLVNNNIPIISGNLNILTDGACLEDKHSIETVMWITVGNKEEDKDESFCQHKHIDIKHFFGRKWLLINYSRAFIIFPGGYGTLSELTELLTVIQTKIRAKVPVILFGKDYWQPFINWLKNNTLKNNLINISEFELLILTDNIEEAFEILKNILSKNLVLN